MGSIWRKMYVCLIWITWVHLLLENVSSSKQICSFCLSHIWTNDLMSKCCHIMYCQLSMTPSFVSFFQVTLLELTNDIHVPPQNKIEKQDIFLKHYASGSYGVENKVLSIKAIELGTVWKDLFIGVLMPIWNMKSESVMIQRLCQRLTKNWGTNGYGKTVVWFIGIKIQNQIDIPRLNHKTTIQYCILYFDHPPTQQWWTDCQLSLGNVNDDLEKCFLSIIRGSQHGADMLGPLSTVLERSTGLCGGGAVVLALEGLYNLCEAEVSHVR